MTITPEEIMAYVDGELDETARVRVTMAALGDPALAESIANQRALKSRLQASFAPVAEAPVPGEWVDAIRHATERPVAQVIDFASARDRKEALASTGAQRFRRAPWAGAAVAASLVLGIFIGSQWQGRVGNGPIVARNGALVATGTLGTVLDGQLASAQNGASIRIMGTFRRAGGNVCRVFSGPQASGIACHAGHVWQVQHLLPGSTDASATYRQAGSHAAELMAMAQNMATGDPLDANQEREAKAAGWR